MIATLASCATPTAIFATADGRVIRCSASEGDVGAPVAQGAYDSCVSDARAAGAIPMAEVGGIGVQPSTESSSTRVLKVGAGSPAEKAGIKAGDLIVAVNDAQVANSGDARRLLFGRANTEVRVTYRSGDTEKTVTLTRIPMTEVMAGLQK